MAGPPENATLRGFIDRETQRDREARDDAMARYRQLTTDPDMLEQCRRKTDEWFLQRMLSTLRQCNIGRRLCAFFRSCNPDATVDLTVVNGVLLLRLATSRVNAMMSPINAVEKLGEEYALALCPFRVTRDVQQKLYTAVTAGIATIFASGDDVVFDLTEA